MKTPDYVKEYLKNSKSAKGCGCRHLGFDGTYFKTNNNYFNATASSVAIVPSSRPYIITVSNTTSNNIQNVTVFGANSNPTMSGVTGVAKGSTSTIVKDGITYRYWQIIDEIASVCSSTFDSTLNYYFPSNLVSEIIIGTIKVLAPQNSAVTDVNIFNSLCAGLSMMTSNGIQISSGLPNVSYPFLLAQSQLNPFSVGKTMLQATGDPNQILQPINLVVVDSNGVASTEPMVPVVDPYQKQAGTIVFDNKYAIDGNTSLVFANVLPNASFNIMTYPDTTVSPSRKLNGDPSTDSSSNPTLIRDLITIVPNSKNVVVDAIV